MEVDLTPISVIIPMYNAKNHINICFQCLLHQTLQNYEVILVDDCSTDNSVEIAEKFIQSFKGKLRILKHKINSGGCSVPRNTGLKYARGKYIFFMDIDDIITDNALEILYKAAESTQADVIHSECYYILDKETFNKDASGNKIINTHVHVKNYQNVNPVKNITVENYDVIKRINDFFINKYMWNV